MINWPSPYLPPINLYNAPKETKMRLQSESENNITIGRGEIMGVVEPSSGRKGWALPGGRYTYDRSVAEKAARFIDRAINHL